MAGVVCVTIVLISCGSLDSVLGKTIAWDVCGSFIKHSYALLAILHGGTDAGLLAGILG